MFHISIWGGLELCLEGLSKPKLPGSMGLMYRSVAVVLSQITLKA